MNQVTADGQIIRKSTSKSQVEIPNLFGKYSISKIYTTQKSVICYFYCICFGDAAIASFIIFIYTLISIY